MMPDSRESISPFISMILSTSINGSSGSLTLTGYESIILNFSPRTFPADPVANSMHISFVNNGIFPGICVDDAYES